jgi:hypothetical protein
MASDCDLAEQIVQQASLAKMSLYRAHSLFERSDGGKPLAGFASKVRPRFSEPENDQPKW